MDARVVALPLDITNPNAVAGAAATATDVDLVINNAGIAPAGDSITGPDEEARLIFETNFFGTLRVATAFAPILAANGGGTLLNVLSSSAWAPVPTVYAASKAAAWSATNALRLQLHGQGTQVVGLLVGMIDTPMSARWDVPKTAPASVVTQAYDGISDGALEVLADDETRQLRSLLGSPAEKSFPYLAEQLAFFTA
ncbi:SDR family NAD(P)-dependent oxidoreductase [Gryllotalpicola reticulitermitis]|uniref:SDR family NAD(P)-dependent oxidoreductase n=1 Tax=Gryllotalpicola reticulitermitis TaxID=1184153 RepID=A0ABV8PZY5_9MICO